MTVEQCKPIIGLSERPIAYLRKLLPDNFDSVGEGGVWKNEEIRDVDEHGIPHAILLLRLVNRVGDMAVEKRFEFNRYAMNLTALLHDTQRIDNKIDINHTHGNEAADLIEQLAGKGFIKYDDDTLKIAINICKKHSYHAKEINKIIELSTDDNLRFFVFCDVLAQVRYEGGEDGFEVTPELLHSILPIFEKTELNQLLSETRELHRQTKRLIDLGKTPLDAAFEAGRYFFFLPETKI